MSFLRLHSLRIADFPSGPCKYEFGTAVDRATVTRSRLSSTYPMCAIADALHEAEGARCFTNIDADRKGDL